MLRGNAQNSAREAGVESMTETTGRQRKPPSINLAITKTKVKVYDDDASGAEAGYWPPAVADFKVSAMAGAEKCLPSFPA
jgi:hypothetical protein